MSTHSPSQRVCPLGQPHSPSTHDRPGSQVVPQAAQFDGSVLRDTQLCPHAVSPATPHSVVQIPFEQTCPDSQVTPQAPQWEPLPLRSTQTPRQSVRPSPHVQAPSTQASPRPHSTWQAPQCAFSDVGSMHSPSQASRAPGQVHEPSAHIWPGPHSMSHPPQCKEFCPRVTHSSPQRTCVPEQSSALASEDSSAEQPARTLRPTTTHDPLRSQLIVSRSTRAAEIQAQLLGPVAQRFLMLA